MAIDEMTFGELLKGKEGMVKVNFTKMREKIKKCEEEKQNQKCKLELKEMGIEWIE